MRKLTSALVAIATAASVLAVAPSAHAAETEGWGMSWGATHTESTINWSSGYSADVKGFITAVGDGYRDVCFYGSNGSTYTGNLCFAAKQATRQWTYAEGHLALPIPGGVQRIDAYLHVQGTGWVRHVHCTRNGCTRDPDPQPSAGVQH